MPFGVEVVVVVVVSDEAGGGVTSGAGGAPAPYSVVVCGVSVAVGPHAAHVPMANNRDGHNH